MAFERGVVAVVFSVALPLVSLTVVVGVSVVGVGVTPVSVDAVKVVEVVDMMVVFNFGLVDGSLVVSVA